MKTETVVVANGVFRPDQVIAVALAKFIGPLDIIRTRDKDVIDNAKLVIGIGEKYDRTAERYDYHQFTPCDPYYGFSASSLVWKKVKEYFKIVHANGAISDVDDLVEAVAARETLVGNSKSSIYKGLFDSIAACNNIEPFSEMQNTVFNLIVEELVDIIDSLAKGNTEQFSQRVLELEEFADATAKKKEPIFLAREKAMRVVGDVLVSKFFPTWRNVSKKQGKPFIMPGDADGEYKIMTDTTKNGIVAVKDSIYVHKNGFVATCKPTGTHIGIAMLRGDMYEVSIKEVDEILTNS